MELWLACPLVLAGVEERGGVALPPPPPPPRTPAKGPPKTERENIVLVEYTSTPTLDKPE
eukprot:scaffold304328_cov32-Tisochrysis_lutea.AAC.1